MGLSDHGHKEGVKGFTPLGLMNYMVRGWSRNAFSTGRQRTKQGTLEEKTLAKDT